MCTQIRPVASIVRAPHGGGGRVETLLLKGRVGWLATQFDGWSVLWHFVSLVTGVESTRTMGVDDIHTIFGAGQVGSRLARRLAARGRRVRLVRRSPPGAEIPGVHWIQGDASDRNIAARACEGSRVVYNCAKPTALHKWERLLEPLFSSIWRAAGRTGARLVQLDNMFMYGRPQRVPFDEQTPMNPCSHHGELRARLADALFEAHARGDVRAVIGRASDLFGPEVTHAAIFRDDVIARIRRGSPVYVFGDPDMPHSYSYAPDVARGLAVLGEANEAALGRAWHLPVAAQLTTRELVERFASAVGSKSKVRVIPEWALRVGGFVLPSAAALSEMTYQWQVPYLVDDSDFRRTFGVAPTPLERAVAQTLGIEPAARAA